MPTVTDRSYVSTCRRELMASSCRRIGSVSSAESTGQENDLELIPAVKMENGHPVEGPFGRVFSSIYIVRELWGPEVASR